MKKCLKLFFQINWLSSFKKAGIMSLMLSLYLTAVAQQATVTGTVTDANGASVPGANVVVKGTLNGVVTDNNGRYSIQGVSPQSVLVFSFVGFVSQEFVVGDQRTINVTLLEDSQQLEEVVVVGYGTRKAGELTGSVSTVKAEEIQKLPAVTAGEVLRNVPGVTVIQSNTPGSDPTIRVRGLGTINNSSPLWVVDGIPGGNVNPNDIETITILKDAAAQAIYGTRAANGVILVTTKAGKKNQKAQVSVNLRAGNQRFTNYYNMLNSQEYGEMLWLEAEHRPGGPKGYSHTHYGKYDDGPPTIPDYIFPHGGKKGQVDHNLYSYITAEEGGTDTYLITEASREGTKWLQEISRVAKFQDFSMNINGGGDNTTYAFTVGYMNREGILRYTGFDRWNLRSNITSDINKWLKIGQSISGSYSNQKGHLTNNAEDSAVGWAFRMNPLIPMYDIAGNYAGTRVGGALGNGRNPMAVLALNQWDNNERLNLTGNAFVQITPLQGLTVKSLVGMNYFTYNRKDIDLVDKSHAERGRFDYVYMTHDYTRQWSWTNTAEYRKAIGLNDITVMVGTEAIDQSYRRTSAQRQNYGSKDPIFMELSTGIDGQANGSNIWGWSLFSIFGRLNYVYDGKYLFEGVLRRDGSSRFAAGNRYGVFPAFSLGWVVSRESFMASTRTWLDNLKLRGGYGLTGNDQMDNYNSYTTFDFTADNEQGTFYAINGANGGQGSLGFRQNRIGNENVKWEATRTTNVGIDIAAFRGLTVSFDVWQRRTTDMLYPRAVPQVYGRATAPSVNVGEMKNNGFDLDIGYRGTAFERELRYQVSLNVSRYKNELVSLSGNENEFLDGGGYREQIYTRSEKGTAFPEFYGYIVDGIFQTEAEAAAHPRAFNSNYNKPGHFKYRDINNDGVINANDRTYIGTPHPTFVTGLNFNLEYKGFDLSGQLYASVGNKMVNYVRRFIDFYQFDGGRSHDRLYNSWGSPHLSDWSKAKLPICERDDVQSQVPSTAFLENAGYLRLRNILLGYNLGKLMNSPAVSSLRVYVQVSNLFTITKYSGLDPEVNVRGQGRDDTRNYGVDSGSWPTPREIMFGISVGL